MTTRSFWICKVLIKGNYSLSLNVLQQVAIQTEFIHYQTGKYFSRAMMKYDRVASGVGDGGTVVAEAVGDEVFAVGDSNKIHMWSDRYQPFQLL